MRALRWLTLSVLLGITAVGQAMPPEYARAWQLIGQGRSKEAVPLLQGLVDSGHGSPPVILLLAESYHALNTGAVGEKYYRELVARMPASGLGHLGLALILPALGRREESIQEAIACANLDPAILECTRLVAGDVRKSASPKAAAARLARLVPMDPGMAESHMASSYLHLILDNAPEAVSPGETALRMAVERGDQRLITETEALLGQVYSHLGPTGMSRAVQYAGSACRRSKLFGDPAMEFAHCSLFASVCFTADSESFRPFLDLISAAQEGKSPATEANMEDSFAQNLARVGRLEEALVHASRALAVASSIPEYKALHNLYLHKGSIQVRLGALESAIASYEQGLTFGDAAEFPGPRAHILSALTVAYNQTGNALDAIRTAEEAIRLFRQLGMDWQAGAELSDVGWAYLTLGDFPTAIRYFTDSLASGRKFLDPGEIVRNSNLLATAYLEMGQAEIARKVLLPALDSLPKAHEPRFGVRAHMLLGEAYSQLRLFDSAREHLALAMQLGSSLKDAWLEAETWTAMGRHLLRTNSLAEAEKSFRSCLAVAEPAELMKPIQEARVGLAEISRRQNQPGQTLKWLQQAVEAVESLRSTAPGPDLRIGLMQRNWSVYSELVQTANLLHQTDPKAGYGDLALTYSERGRARVLLDLLEESRSGLKAGLTTAQAERQRALEQNLSAATTRLRSGNTAPARAAVNAAETALRQWSTQLRVENPRYHHLKYPDPLDADAIRRLAAESGVAIVEYALGPRSSRVWVAARGELHSAALPAEAVISSKVARLRECLSRHPSGPAAEEYKVWARDLYTTLIGPIRNHLSSNAVTVVVADGLLLHLPFEALMSPSGQFLVELTTITYAPSASVFAELERAGIHASERALLALGNPDFGEHRPAVAGSGAMVMRDVYRAAGLSLRPLPGTESEVRSIARLFAAESTKILLGRQASEAAFKSEPLGEYRRLHLATHALIDERAPARSGLVLSLVGMGKEDGVLQISEIMGLRLDAELVTLSACQTGLGKLVRGEGMIGFTGAFLFAGARRLAVSLWPVSDTFTPDLMRGFYAKMRDGAAPSNALRDVKLRMLKSDIPAYRHPHYWAGFVMVGAR